jgi:hypothetical protein
VADASVVEGDSGTVLAQFLVTLSSASEQVVTIAFATAGQTATAGADYTETAGTLTFPPGQTSQTVLVPVVGDTLDEADETFRLTLSAPGNATLADPVAIGTIIDDDRPLTVTINNVTVTEGDVGVVNAVFTVTLSAASSQTVTIDFATADGTATAGTDYTTTTGTVTFPPGQTTRTITVPVLGDNLDESDETFFVNLTNPTNATVPGAPGVGTIRDDDTAPVAATAPVAVNDNFLATQSTPLTVPAPGVLANDTDAEGDRLTVLLVSGPASGGLVLNPDGSFTYTPNPDFVGTDSFNYRATDGTNSSNVATVTIGVRDATGPTLTDLSRFGFHTAPTFLVLTFSEELDPARAGDVSNYRLVGSGGQPIGINSAVYDAATRTVTLSPNQLLNLNVTYQVTVNGSTAGGLTDRSGNLIDGDRDGRPGGDLSRTFGREALRDVAVANPQRTTVRRRQIPVVTNGLPTRFVNTLLSPRFRRLLNQKRR